MSKFFSRLLFSLFAALLFAELLFQLGGGYLEWKVPIYHYRKYFPGLHAPDANLIWHKIPSASLRVKNVLGEEIEYKTNSLGLRDPERLNLGDARKRIFVLGDSFAFGMGVMGEQRFSQRLEKKLQESNPQAEVWNFGTLAFGTDQEYLQWQEWKKQEKPAALILQMTDNDLSDVIEHLWFTSKGEKILSNDQLPERIFDRIPLGRILPFSEFSFALTYFWQTRFRSHLATAEIDLGLARMKFLLDRFALDAKALKIPFVVVMASDWGEHVYGKEGARRYRDLVVVEAANGVQLIESKMFTDWNDLLPFPDLHWNARGNQKVADRLFEVLK